MGSLGYDLLRCPELILPEAALDRVEGAMNG
jgi:hypothetical protein